MIKLISFRSLLSLGVAALLSQAVLADEGLTPAEANTMVKEDIASAQVMTEVCPAIIGKNAKFDHNTHQLIQSYLQNYSDKSMNFDKIQSDTEYKSILNEAREAAKETSKDEQKSVCDDVVNYEA
ncbi:MCR_0457 family protein [Acinetobacter bohemicus]|uniref:MCR_0457 family protein n=1 Tax=Acinetobacter bohemicus TaxID=1435036 RepID=UPI003FA309A9